VATCLRYVVERMRAEILTIGDELCRGEVVDTNSSYLAARLWDLGITTRWMTSCNDEEADIAAALALATGRADLVVCSGGLGPTEDDLTVDVVSRAAGVAPVVDEPARARMLERFGRLLSSGQVPGQDVDELTRIQLRKVRVPTGSRVHRPLERAGIAGTWAGLYEMTPDRHPIIGPVTGSMGLYLACGFSGHGFQHAPIVGKFNPVLEWSKSTWAAGPT